MRRRAASGQLCGSVSASLMAITVTLGLESGRQVAGDGATNVLANGSLRKRNPCQGSEGRHLHYIDNTWLRGK